MREMKKTTIPFCEYIPDKWQVLQNRYLFCNHSVKVGENYNEYQLLSLTTSGVKKKDINASGGKVPTSYYNYQTVSNGDMIFCLFDLDCSAVFSGLSSFEGMITSAYDVFKPEEKYVDKHYIEYWFQYVFSYRYYKMYSKSIRYTITSDMFKAITTPVPPIEEQRRIGEYLDSKCTQIDALISNAQQQIEKLKAYKQSLITETVTKGLNPDVPMKDSGVEWIGETPEDWEVAATKYLFNIESGATPKSDNHSFFDGEVVWVTPADFKTEDIFVSSGKKNLTIEGLNSCSATLVPKGSLIFSKRAPIGSVVISSVELCTNQGCLSCIPYTSNLTKYYYYVMSICTEQYNLLGSGTTFKEISASNFMNFSLPLPPISEQQAIVSYLDKKCAQIDKLITLKQQKIEKLQQYKKSLIYEYATGKKEV